MLKDITLGQFFPGESVVHDNLALGAINNAHVTIFDVLGNVKHRENRRNLHGAGNNGRVRGASAGLGNNGCHVVLVHVRCHGGGKLMHYHNRVLGQG